MPKCILNIRYRLKMWWIIVIIFSFFGLITAIVLYDDRFEGIWKVVQIISFDCLLCRSDYRNIEIN